MEKGQPGYLNKYKKKQLRLVMLYFSLVLICFLVGIIVYHTNKNVFTIPAVLLVLPAARALGHYLVIFSYASYPDTKVEALYNLTKSQICLMFDLVVTTNESTLYVPVGAIHKEQIIFWLPAGKKPEKAEKLINHIKQVLGFSNAMTYDIIVTENESEFITLIDNLETEEVSSQKQVVSSILTTCI